MMGCTVFRIMAGFPTWYSFFLLSGKYLCSALAAGAHWPQVLAPNSICIPKTSPVKGDKQGYSWAFGGNHHSSSLDDLGEALSCVLSPLCC